MIAVKICQQREAWHFGDKDGVQLAEGEGPTHSARHEQYTCASTCISQDRQRRRVVRELRADDDEIGLLRGSCRVEPDFDGSKSSSRTRHAQAAVSRQRSECIDRSKAGKRHLMPSQCGYTCHR